LAFSLLGMLAGLALPACKQSADANKTVKEPPKTAQESPAQARGEATQVQQAASNCRQRIQETAQEHAANAKRMQEANVLAMKEVTQREQLQAKRELVRRFLASNEALKDLLANEDVGFTEALAKLNVPLPRIDAESRAFQSSVRDKAVLLGKRETDQRIGSSLLGALDLLDELCGQWNYNKEYDQVQFSPPGALRKYNDFLAAIEAASREQKEAQQQ
jgi:hypothetical protein